MENWVGVLANRMQGQPGAEHEDRRAVKDAEELKPGGRRDRLEFGEVSGGMGDRL